MRRSPAPTLAATTLLLLTACTGGDVTSPDAGTTAGAPADAPADAGEPLEPVTAGCLVGTWQLDVAALQAELRALVADSGVEVTLDGEATYDFADGGGFRVTAGTTATVTSSADGSTLTYETTTAGDADGTWSATDDQVVVSDVDPRDLDVTRRATMDGEDLDVPASSDDPLATLLEGLPPTSSTGACGADRATLAMPLVQDEGSEPVVVTYTLRR